jgi:single-strand DNA-binding protein
MNLHILKGNLGRDPELTYTPAGDAVCKFSIAVPHPYHPKDKEKTTWANCVAWRKTAENIAKFFTKGQQILVTGFTEERKWEKDGQKHSMMQTTVQTFQFCGSTAGSPGKTTDTNDSIPF